MKIETYACDNCGKQTQEVNRWWYLLSKDRNHVSVYRWVAKVSCARHLSQACGQECALSLISRWMTTGSFEKQTESRTAFTP